LGRSATEKKKKKKEKVTDVRVLDNCSFNYYLQQRNDISFRTIKFKRYSQTRIIRTPGLCLFILYLPMLVTA
jgi:hypothetical protein